MDPDGARALHVAQNIASGEGQIIKYVDPTAGLTSHPDITKPPLYPALIALFILAGVTPKLAGWGVTFVAFAAATAFLYLLSRRVTSRAGGLLVAGLFATLMTGVRWGINLHEESVFLAISFAALWVQMGLSPSDTRLWLRQFFIGMLAGLAMVTSYQGLPLVVSVGIFALWNAWKLRAPMLLVAYAGGLLLVGAFPFAHFLDAWMSGVRPGLDKGEPSWYAIISGVASAWQRGILGGVRIWLDDGSASDLVIVAMFYMGLFLLLLRSWLDERLRLLVAYVTLYMAMVILQLGGQGKPYFETRYNMPVETIIVLLVVVLGVGWLNRLSKSSRRAMAGLGMVMLAAYLYAQAGRYQQMMSGRTIEFCPAPEAIAWVRTHIPPGSVIMGTQCTYQLYAESNAYPWLAIPPARSEETPPPRWTEEDMVAAGRRMNAEWVVLITGSKEPLLEKPGYGPFVTQLLAGQGTDRVRLAARLPDGLIYRIEAVAPVNRPKS